MSMLDRFRRVSPDSRCPVCDGPDWCLVAHDGSCAVCQREPSQQRWRDAGWFHRLGGSAARYLSAPRPRVSARRLESASKAAFTPGQAAHAWDLSLQRALELARIGGSCDGLGYLGERGLVAALETEEYGFLPHDDELTDDLRQLARRGYRVVVPLWNQEGELTCIQLRAVRDVQPKVRVPRGARISGCVFANGPGRALLRGEAPDAHPVLLGEGLTDFLALSLACGWPLLAVPGVGSAAGCIGPWVRNRRLVLAVDCDEAGDCVVPDIAKAAYAMGATAVTRLRWPSGRNDACDVLQGEGDCGLAEIVLAALCGGDQ